MRTAFAYEVNQLLNLPLRSAISLAGTERDRMKNKECGRLRATVLSIQCVTINAHESIWPQTGADTANGNWSRCERDALRLSIVCILPQKQMRKTRSRCIEASVWQGRTSTSAATAAATATSTDRQTNRQTGRLTASDANHIKVSKCSSDSFSLVANSWNWNRISSSQFQFAVRAAWERDTIYKIQTNI